MRHSVQLFSPLRLLRLRSTPRACEFVVNLYKSLKVLPPEKVVQARLPPNLPHILDIPVHPRPDDLRQRTALNALSMLTFARETPDPRYLLLQRIRRPDQFRLNLRLQGVERRLIPLKVVMPIIQNNDFFLAEFAGLRGGGTRNFQFFDFGF